MGDVRVRRLQSLGEREIRELSDVLIDCVEGGASVSFISRDGVRSERQQLEPAIGLKPMTC